MKKFLVLILSLVVVVGMASGAFAYSIGVLTDGSQNKAYNNLSYYASQNAGTDLYSLTPNSTFNSMSVATLAATYDVLVLPWYVNGTANLDWTTRVLAYMNLGGSILWEDPANVGTGGYPSASNDLADSGIIFGSTAGYTSDISLVAPFDSNGAVGYYHTHFGIVSASSDWDVWSTDGGGNIHGVYGEFGTNGGRMILGVSDNLYHPNMAYASESDHYNLLVNELNWLGTGSVDVSPVPEPGTMLLLGAGLIGFVGFRRKFKI